MTARGPAWEGDPAPARLGYDPQTAPLPYGARPATPTSRPPRTWTMVPAAMAPATTARTTGTGPGGAGRAGPAACCAGWSPCWSP